MTAEPQGNFVWTCRLPPEEKGVPRKQVPLRPFGTRPVARHGSVILCETRAICRHIDQALGGPRLIRVNAADPARVERCLSLVITGFDPVFAHQCLPGGAPDPNRRGLAHDEKGDILSRQSVHGTAVSGREVCLPADVILLPVLHFRRQTPESGVMLNAASGLDTWLVRHLEQPIFQAAVPSPVPERS